MAKPQTLHENKHKETTDLNLKPKVVKLLVKNRANYWDLGLFTGSKVLIYHLFAGKFVVNFISGNFIQKHQEIKKTSYNVGENT